MKNQILLLAAVFAWAAAASAQESPLFDKGCSISAGDRLARIQFMDNKIDGTPQRGGAKADAEKTYADFEVVRETLRQANHAYVESNGLYIASNVLLFVVGLRGVPQMIEAGKLTLAGGNILTSLFGLGSTAQSLFHKWTLETGELDQNIQDELKGLYQNALSPDPVDIRFLSGACGIAEDERCDVRNLKIDRALADIERWHDRVSAKTQDGAGIWEYKTHLFGLRVANVELPYTSNMAMVMELRLAYFEALRAALIQDGEACGQLAPICADDGSISYLAI